MLSIIKSIAFFHLRLSDFDKPLLVIQGSMNFLNQTEAMMRLFQRIAVKDKKLKIINNGYHELYMDLEKKNFVLALIAWIDERAVQGCPVRGFVAAEAVRWQFPQKRSSLALKVLCLMVGYLGIVFAFDHQAEEERTVQGEAVWSPGRSLVAGTEESGGSVQSDEETHVQVAE